ncbi:MAG TPA: hypothetical protein VFY45_15445 [Baekduia sp.]|nr:hypothetical protein [Baekduia sp.]
MHAAAAAFAAHDAAQEVVRGWATGVLGGGPLASEVRAAVEQLFGDQRLVLAADLLAGAALCRDVAAVGEVAEHVADRVGAEEVAARRALTAVVEPLSEVTVGVAAGGVDLEDGEDERCALGIGGRDAVFALEIAPGEAAGQEPLAGLLLEAHRRPERERDGVVLIEDLVD